MIQELDVLKQCSHTNIMTVYEILHDSKYFYIVSELLEGGELMQRLINSKKYNESTAAYILKQILLAVNYMHK